MQPSSEGGDPAGGLCSSLALCSGTLVPGLSSSVRVSAPASKQGGQRGYFENSSWCPQAAAQSQGGPESCRLPQACPAISGPQLSGDAVFLCSQLRLLQWHQIVLCDVLWLPFAAAAHSTLLSPCGLHAAGLPPSLCPLMGPGVVLAEPPPRFALREGLMEGWAPVGAPGTPGQSWGARRMGLPALGAQALQVPQLLLCCCA